MRTLLTAALFLGLTFAVVADDPKPAVLKKDAPATAVKVKAEATLKIGDPAPKLAATKWMQGQEVTSFEKGKIYVVEFWATWCGPCIVMMPHMAEMQEHLRSKGVTFIGFSSVDGNNSQEKVQTFVDKRGKKLGYTFAFADNRDTDMAWMKAANRNGIPCCFVVDKDSKIAYIGHPMYLDMVLPKVVDGTWKGAADVEAMEKIEKDVNAVFTSFGPKGDPETALKGLAEFEEKYPLLKDIPYFRANRISMTIRTGKLEEARKMAEDYLAKGTKQEDPILLRTVASTTMTAKENKELMAVAVKAADTFVKVAGSDDLSALLLAAEVNITAGDKAKGTDYAKQAVAAAEKEIKTNGDKNYNSLLNAAEANFLASDKAKAQEYAKKAIALTEAPNFNPNLKRFIEGRAKKYLEENK